MTVVPLAIPEVKLVKPHAFPDDRGFFIQNYHQQQYADAGITDTFVQDSWSQSKKGVLRGLHYQLRNAQAKLVSVVRGEIFDVAVDIRRGSPTFGQWVGEILSEDNHHQLYIPQGFAHGFCVLSETADVFYKCNNLYTPGDEYGIQWNDPDLAISWPITTVTTSPKDQDLPSLNKAPSEQFPVY